MIRLRALLNFSISIDPTWDYTDVSIWTGAELASGILCASLPAIRQLLTMTLPKRFLSLLTSRSQSRSTPMPGAPRGSTPSSRRQRKDRSMLPIPSSSEYGISSYGTRTDISSSSLTKSQIHALHGLDARTSQHVEPAPRSWLPMRTFFHSNKSRSFQTSFWSSVDRRGSPPLSPPPGGIQVSTDLRGTSVARTEIADGTGKASVDEQMELLRVPEGAYRARGQRGGYGNDLTALPSLGILPDADYPQGRYAHGWK